MIATSIAPSMEIPRFCGAAGKHPGVEFTDTLFHTVKLNFELLN